MNVRARRQLQLGCGLAGAAIATPTTTIAESASAVAESASTVALFVYLAASAANYAIDPTATTATRSDISGARWRERRGTLRPRCQRGFVRRHRCRHVTAAVAVAASEQRE